MTRPAALLLALTCFSTATSARTLDPKTPPSPPRPDVESVRRAQPGATTPPAAGELRLTERTQVLLDGRPCEYKAVPPGAAIVRVEVAEDRCTILRIEFRSPK